MTARTSARVTGSEICEPAPFARALPALYREPELDDRTALRLKFTEALDAVLAPVFCHARQPARLLRPEDSRPRTSSTGSRAGSDWSSTRAGRRAPPQAGRRSGHLHQKRGTKAAGRKDRRDLCGVEHGKVTIEESGGVSGRTASSWSPRPSTRITSAAGSPGSGARSRLTRSGTPRRRGRGLKRVVRDVVTKVKPAHVCARWRARGGVGMTSWRP